MSGAAGTATQLVGALRAGELSAREAVARQLGELHRVHDETGAVVWFDDERALAEADAADRRFGERGAMGPLHGLPVTVKDWIDVEGFPCAGGATAHAGRRPSADATAVARLRGAGAIVIAKTRVANDDSGRRVRNPHRRDRSSGGTSSGEAAAVAALGSVVGLGSDSGGSIRLPAAWCGVHGLKPTAGRVPTTGHFPRVGAISDGRTQLGPMARCVADLELLLSVMAGVDWRDGGAAPVPLMPSGAAELSDVRFAVVTEEPGYHCAPAVRGAVETAAADLARTGAARVEWGAPWLADAFDITQRYWDRAHRSGDEVDRDLRDWDRFRFRYLRAAQQVDLLVTPATATVAPLERPLAGLDYVFTLPASLTGSPAVVVPVGVDEDGMPLAVQLVGRPWEDHRVLAAADAIGHPIPDPPAR